jgi:hypothetical protein
MKKNNKPTQIPTATPITRLRTLLGATTQVSDDDLVTLFYEDYIRMSMENAALKQTKVVETESL